MGVRWTWILILVLAAAVLLLAGCSSRMYEQYMKEGAAALKLRDYEMAVASFEKAQEVKETEEAAELILATKAVKMASDHLGEGKFEEAEVFAEEAIFLGGKGAAHDEIRSFAEEIRKQAVDEKDRIRLIQELEKAKVEMEKGMFHDAYERAFSVANDSNAIRYDVASAAQELMNEILDRKKEKISREEAKRKKRPGV